MLDPMRTILFLAVFSSQIFAYVAGSAGIQEGGVELTMKAELMRGLAGPENLAESQQRLIPSVNIFELGAGYNFGALSVFQDIKARLTSAQFTSAEETLSGTTIYSKNEGWIAGIELSSNLIHDVDKIFGIFVRTQHPINMNVAKFVNPKVDRIGLGVQSGFKFNESFGQETVVFFGSGLNQDGMKQNPSLSVSLLGAWILNQGFFADGAALKFGPFYDGDLSERSDLGYGTTGIRTFRIGAVLSASYNISKHLGLDLAYIQKFSGSYFRATKDFIFTLRMNL